MKFAKALRCAAQMLLLALSLSTPGCGKNPSEPNPNDLNTYDVSPKINNAAGAPSIVEVQLLLDGVVVDDETPPSPVASLEMITPGIPSLGGGKHTLKILLVRQTVTIPTGYSIPKFNFTLFSCLDGVFADNGNDGVRQIPLPALATDLVAGESFTYTFTTPDCDVEEARRRPLRAITPAGTAKLPRFQ